jgi:hypothetical protein
MAGRAVRWAKATLIRYADDFVILCRKITPRLERFVSETIEQWLGLKINRDKTRIYEVKASENGLDFLGYNFSMALAPHGPKGPVLAGSAEQEVGWRLGRCCDRESGERRIAPPLPCRPRRSPRPARRLRPLRS